MLKNSSGNGLDETRILFCL